MLICLVQLLFKLTPGIHRRVADDAHKFCAVFINAPGLLYALNPGSEFTRCHQHSTT
jgi:hypothetical protein